MDTTDVSLKEAGLADKAKNLTHAMTDWAKGGFHTVSDTDFHRRLQFCHSCPHWDSSAFLGKGACKLCGCSVAKLYLSTSFCPHPQPRWLKIKNKPQA